MSIHILTGKPGTGKTARLTAIGFSFLEKGVDVYSNYKLNYSGKNLHYYKSIEDILHIRKGIILMDEAQIYFNSRKWDRLPESWQYKLQQHRKQGLHIYGTVQNIKRLDTLMRELVSNYYECTKIFNLVLVREYDISESEKKQNRTLFWTTYFFITKKIKNSYDTLEEIKF